MNKPVTGLHFVTGEKGGVGKSLWTMTLLEYLQQKSIPYLFWDTDRTSPDVGQIYEPSRYGESSTSTSNSSNYLDAEEKTALTLPLVYFSEDEEDIFLADILLEKARDHLVIVNLPAQVSVMVDRWLQQQAILSLAQEEGIDLTFWFVTDGSPESLTLLEQSMSKYGKEINHIVVLNEGLNKRIQGNLTSHSAKKAIEQNALAILTMPLLTLSQDEKKRLKTEKLPLGKASDRNHSSSLSLIAKQRIKQFLKHCHQELDELALFVPSKAEKAS